MESQSNLSPISNPSSTSLKSLKLALLAGTCLTSTASAATVVEATDFGDFGGTFLTSSTLTPGTTLVQGAVTPFSDLDYFSFTGLNSGVTYNLNFVAAFSGALDYQLFNSSETLLSSNSFGGGGFLTSGTVPSDGILVVRINNNEGSAYSVSINPEAVPEPSAALLGGIGLAAAALRRKRNIAE